MEQQTFIRHAQTFSDCSHAPKGFTGPKAAYSSLAGLGVGSIAVASTTLGSRELDASPPRGGRLSGHFSSAADVTFSRPDA